MTEKPRLPINSEEEEEVREREREREREMYTLSHEFPTNLFVFL